MKRRTFLHTIAWLGGGLAAGCNTKLFRGKAGARVKGRVTSKGRRLAGVVVSDGYEVVQTNRHGKYSLTLSPGSRHVFVSTPSGYRFPHDQFVSRHYAEVAEGMGEVNFELEKLADPDETHQFIVWADPQVKNAADVSKMRSQSVPDVQQLLKSLPKGIPVHGITVGDIVWDTPNLYADYTLAVGAMGIPFFQVLGNHDMDLDGGSDETSDLTFMQHYGPTYYSFNRGKAHYVVLDNVYYSGEGKKYKGFLTGHQIQWLQKDLAFVPKDHLVIVCAHIPFHNGVENNVALYDVLSGYDAHIMTGHTHTNRNVYGNGWYEHVHGTVCGAWWTGPVCGDGTPPGYGVYTVKGNALSWQYKSTGKPLDYQLSLQTQGSDKNREVVVNVWNWDEDWKVEWWRNQHYGGVLENVHDYDPQTVTLYKGDKLPAGRPFVEPKKTHHLFKIPAETGGQYMVKATDSFGKVYESYIHV